MTAFDRNPELWPEFLLVSEAAEASERPIAELMVAMRRGWLPYLPGRPAVIERRDLLEWVRWSPEKREAEEAEFRRHQMDQARAEWRRKWRWKRYIRAQNARST